MMKYGPSWWLMRVFWKILNVGYRIGRYFPQDSIFEKFFVWSYIRWSTFCYGKDCDKLGKQEYLKILRKGGAGR